MDDMKRRLTISTLAFLCATVVIAAPPGEKPESPKPESPKNGHWAFRPAVRSKPPRVSDDSFVRNPIDAFILARLEKAGVAPSPEADRVTLIRRLSFDLRGLPPSQEEVRAFVSDRDPFAYESLVNRMLSSKHYGERWARHWLDVARYADSNGYTRDFGREIWKYRDWCIEAFRRDLPFDQFVIEQLAGDLLPGATLDQIIATGFHRNTLINEEGGTDAEQFRVDAVADRVDTTGVGLLGLTIGCARCHDHKFDPISQKEYYQLFAFLNSCDEPTIDAPSADEVSRDELGKRAAIRARIARIETTLTESKAKELLAKQFAWEATITPEQRVKYPGDVQEGLLAKPAERSDKLKKLVADAYRKTPIARKDFTELAEIESLRASEPKIAKTMVMRERQEPRPTFIHVRGNFLEKGALVAPGVPSVLHPLRGPRRGSGEIPTRLDLARWIVSPENPLTPRVVMNRFWMRFFGRGLVQTENDFGTRGTPPTHPALLDWLATEFVRNGWSMRAMHRCIVTSATYRQSSRRRSDLDDIDPSNALLGRQVRLRLEAEIIRDAALAASGLLVTRIGGPGVFPPQPDGVFEFTQDVKEWKTETGPDRYRRGMYTHFWRSSPYPSLIVFDFPESNVTCTRRVRSNTPLQALTLANDEVFVECARALARLVLEEEHGDDRARIVSAFSRCLARPPSDAESIRLARFLDERRADFRSDPNSASAFAGASTDEDAIELAAWAAVARAVLNVDEFITRE
jgi:hypothetical protein